MACQRLPRAAGERDYTVFVAFPFTNDYLLATEVDVFHAYGETLEQAEPGAVEQGRNQPLARAESGEHGSHFVAGEDYWQACRHSGANDSLHPREWLAERFAVQEQ